MSQELDLVGLLQGKVRDLGDQIKDTEQKVYGVTTGEVTDLDDPKFLGRVKVKLPWLSNSVDSAWAGIATPWAGSQRGSYLLPEVGDQVLVAFRHGDLRYPYIIGFLWVDLDRPPEITPRLDRRELKSKSGHQLVFDDLIGMWSLTLQSQGGHTVTLDDSPASMGISISDSTGTVSIELDSLTGKISISTDLGSVDVSAPAGRVSVEGAAVDIHATGTLNLTGDGSVVIKGATVAIN